MPPPPRRNLASMSQPTTIADANGEVEGICLYRGRGYNVDARLPGYFHRKGAATVGTPGQPGFRNKVVIVLDRADRKQPVRVIANKDSPTGSRIADPEVDDLVIRVQNSGSGNITP
jgi:hypothetical protein